MAGNVVTLVGSSIVVAIHPPIAEFVSLPASASVGVVFSVGVSFHDDDQDLSRGTLTLGDSVHAFDLSGSGYTTYVDYLPGEAGSLFPRLEVTDTLGLTGTAEGGAVSVGAPH